MASRFSPRILGALWLFGVASLAWAAPPLDLSHEMDIPRLVQLLVNGDDWPRSQAAERLHELRGPQLVEPVLALLTDPKATVRANVAQGIGTIFQHAVPQDPRLARALLPLLHDPDALVCAKAVYALGQLADPLAFEPLRQLAGETANPLRRDALGALREFQDPRAIAVLAAALRDQDAAIRVTALCSLSMIAHPLTANALTDRLQESITAEDVTALVDFPPDPVSSFGLHSGVREMARLLADRSDTSALCATPLLLSPRPAARALGALLLSWKHDLRAVDSITLLLHDPDESVRWAAARALAAIGDVRALDPLLATLANDTPHVQAAAARALGAIGDRRACEPLAHLLATPDDSLRGAVVLALGRLGDGRAFDALLPQLHATDPRQRAQAVEAFGRLSDERALDALAVTLDDPYNVVRVQGIRALGHLHAPRAVELLVNAMTQATLGKPLPASQYGDHAEILNSNYNISEPRVEAVQALGAGHDPRAFEPLLSAMLTLQTARSSDLGAAVLKALAPYTDARVLQALIQRTHDGSSIAPALLKERGPNGIYALQQLLFDPTFTLRGNYMRIISELRGEALTMFMDDPRMLETLLGLVTTGDGDIRASVISLLAELKDPESLEGLYHAARRPDPSYNSLQSSAIHAILAIQRAHPEAVDVEEVRRVLLEIAQTAPPFSLLAVHSALVRLGERAAIAPLLATLRSPDPVLSRFALFAVRDIEEPAVVEAALAALHDPDPQVRNNAAFNLAGSEVPRIRQAMLACLWDTDSGTRFYALLGMPANPETFATLLGWMAVASEHDRRMLAEPLSHWQSPEAVGVLCGLLHDPMLPLATPASPLACPRIQAAQSLAALGDVRAVEPLIAALDDGPLACRQAMAEALGRLKDRRAVPPLITALERFSGDARHTAAVALTTLTGQTLGDDPAKWRAWWQQAVAK